MNNPYSGMFNGINKLDQQMKEANAALEQSTRISYEVAQERIKREKLTAESTAKTALHVESLDHQVGSIDSRLEAESVERKEGDKKNKRWNIAAIIIAATALLIELIVNRAEIAGFLQGLLK
ncbi:hypothetical protein LJC49_06710 [Ruminococcaceae bacterium OttesenSCG-928-I18]|nr:hypothetical protein [Ruminococcaceae bacterium OttesenSCG-928-I18]